MRAIAEIKTRRSSEFKSELAYQRQRPLNLQHSESRECFNCGKADPQIECLNCPKQFHLKCLSLASLPHRFVCEYCHSRNSTNCAECEQSLLCPIEQQAKHQGNNQSRSKSIRVCTFCSRLFHQQCTNIQAIETGSQHFFFHPKHSFICWQCQQHRGFTNCIDYQSQECPSVLTLLRCCSPIHRVWVPEQVYIDRLKQQRVVQQDHNLFNNISLIEIEDILCMKVPYALRAASMGRVIAEVQARVSGETDSRYLVRWKQSGQPCISWEDENVVLAFPGPACKFLALLQYQYELTSETGKPSLASIVQQRLQLAKPCLLNTPVTLPEAYEKLAQQITQSINHSPSTLLLLSPRSDTPPLPQLLIAVVQKVAQGKSPHSIVVVAREQDLKEWRVLVRRHLGRVRAVVIRTNQDYELASTYLLHFAMGNTPKYQLLLLPVGVFFHSHIPDCLRDQLVIVAQAELQAHHLFRLSTVDRLVVASVRKENEVSAAISMLEQRALDNEGYFQLFDIDTIIRGPCGQENQQQNIANIVQAISLSDSQNSSSINGSPNHNRTKKSSQKLSASAFATGQGSKSPLSQPQRMLFHTFVMEHGCMHLVMDSCNIKRVLSTCYPQYGQLIRECSNLGYLQHCQLYLSTLKDLIRGLDVGQEELDSYYFGCEPRRVFKHICSSVRASPQHRRMLHNINQ